MEYTFCHIWAKLKISPSHSGNVSNIWMGIQGEETFEKVEIGMNSKESFTQMHKNRDMEHGTGRQMMKLDSPIKQ